MNWMIDPVTRELRPRVMILIGLGIFAMGAYALVASVDAVSSGSQFVGNTSRRSMSTRLSSDVAMLVSAFMTFAGAGITTVAVGKALPGLAERKWIKRTVALVFAIGLIVLLVASIGLVGARLLR